MAGEGKKIIAVNRKARHDYFVEDTYEAGIALFGTEVKSVRAGQVNLKDSYCRVIDGELFALGVHISPYEKGNIFNKDPMRQKKLLMHKREILKLQQYTTRDSYTLVPLSLYFSGSNVKMEVGLCKGKKLWDKRESTAKAESGREIEREMKSRAKSGRYE
jgi:SsrA-binding protein